MRAMFRLFNRVHAEKVSCEICGRHSELVSKSLAVCADCIKTEPDKALPFIEEVHAKSRRRFDLPHKPPRDPEGVRCGLCVNDCRIPTEGRGYCGLRTNIEGKLRHL
ncbi:MAG: radical SAM protein, partial [Candidatus Hydrothermarchaeales archaeon]